MRADGDTGRVCIQAVNIQHLNTVGLCTGSILFTLSCSTGLFQIMARHSLRNRLCVAYPYAAGSLLYTWGAYSTMVASADVLRQLELQGGGAQMQGQTAASGQPVQLVPAAQPTGADACEAPTASTPVDYTLFPEASGCESHLLHTQHSACRSTMPQERLSTTPKSLQRACTTQKACEQSPALLTSSGNRRKQQCFTLQLCPWSAHSWATLDLAGIYTSLSRP